MKTAIKKPLAKRSDPVEDFIALPLAEKNRIYAEIDSQSREEQLAGSRPLNAKERAEWRVLQKKLREEFRRRGRPRVGRGVKKVSVSMEKSLLTRADHYAKAHNLNRSELFTRGVLRLLEAS